MRQKNDIINSESDKSLFYLGVAYLSVIYSRRMQTTNKCAPSRRGSVTKPYKWLEQL